ncbi:ABC transporter ATP-binding protein [Alkalicoccobacillus porphyridii]|uniref:ABC transporter ATP-binding protein n=1 Tax=Alkalicoccobacillus porphyridii TaxID=2597270 RepID=A0A554A145_9BACI|nr:ABC transporter ATP-binding protein [Alkalicoccobacillus porphyridii]TSB47418.1 ABC transporter ATP-binding protein [Alkalicoccobacillus porphyridii]
MGKIVIRNLEKSYDNQKPVVQDFSLSIQEREFIVFVGPSGCGKTTTLRMIAGLEEISNGELEIDGRNMNRARPKERRVAMVFQNYALFPYMTVFDNLAYGLKMRKVPMQKIIKEVHSVAELLGLSPLLDRKPKALSGGQKQRVALGRAVLRGSEILLMDEPLSNLDAKLRVQMRAEITRLHKKLNTTTIYVTHDQTEAMTMASRIVVLKDGLIQQIGSPMDVYTHPANLFVARFLGSPPMNVIVGKVMSYGVRISQSQIIKTTNAIPEEVRGNEILVGVRPEHIQIVETEGLEVVVEYTEQTGIHLFATLNTGEDKIIARLPGATNVKLGDQIRVCFQEQQCRFFDPVTEEALKL